MGISNRHSILISYSFYVKSFCRNEDCVQIPFIEKELPWIRTNNLFKTWNTALIELFRQFLNVIQMSTSTIRMSEISNLTVTVVNKC